MKSEPFFGGGALRNVRFAEGWQNYTITLFILIIRKAVSAKGQPRRDTRKQLDIPHLDHVLTPHYLFLPQNVREHGKSICWAHKVLAYSRALFPQHPANPWPESPAFE